MLDCEDHQPGDGGPGCDCIPAPDCSRSSRRKEVEGRRSILSTEEGRGGESSTGWGAGTTLTSRWRPTPGESDRQSRATLVCRDCIPRHSHTQETGPVERHVELHTLVTGDTELHSCEILELEEGEVHSPKEAGEGLHTHEILGPEWTPVDVPEVGEEEEELRNLRRGLEQAW